MSRERQTRISFVIEAHEQLYCNCIQSESRVVECRVILPAPNHTNTTK